MNRILVLVLSTVFATTPVISFADSNADGGIISPGSFTRLDPGIVPGITGPAWCYDDDANTTLILMGEREKIRCDFKLTYELEKEKIRSSLIIGNLNLRIETLTKEHEKLVLIKDKEISRLTEITSRVPNDHSAWWASGGFVVGVLTTIAITYAVVQ